MKIVLSHQNLFLNSVRLIIINYSLFPGQALEVEVTAPVNYKDKLTAALAQKNNAKGLAIILYNSYREHKYFMLRGTEKDGQTMMDTFNSLGFATLMLSDVNERLICEVISALASYTYPVQCNTIAIYFSGHGAFGGILMGSDGKDFNFEEAIIKRLNKTYNKDVSDAVTKANILVFMDACEGPVADETLPPNNMLVAYAASEGYVTREDENGGIWTQALANTLQEKRDKAKLLKDILKDVPQAMSENTHPIVWDNNGVGNRLYL
jgi:hypothetical protein